MRTDLWRSFHGLLPARPRLLGTVTSHNPDGTSSLVTFDGSTMRAWGQVEGATPPYNAFVRDGRVEAAAPNLPLVELDV